MFTLTTLDTAPKVPFNLDGRIMFSNAKVELVHLTLNPNDEIPVHTNPFDVIFYPLEGELLLTIEEQNIAICPGTSVSVAKGVNRGLANRSKETAKLLVIKVF